MKLLLLNLFVIFVLCQHNHETPPNPSYDNCFQDNFATAEWTISEKYNNISMKITFPDASNGWVFFQNNLTYIGRYWI